MRAPLCTNFDEQNQSIEKQKERKIKKKKGKKKKKRKPQIATLDI
jgi:hypothetical protein